MNKKLLIISVSVAVVVLVIAVVLCLNNSGDKTPEITATPVAGQEEQSGLEDSIFENEENVQSPEETTGAKPGVTPNTTENNEGDKATAAPTKNPTAKPEVTPTTKPVDTPTPTATASADTKKLDYATYKAMKPSEQQAYMESFNDMDAFFEWYNAAKDKYEKENPSIEVDGGVIDLEDIVNGKK
ncbi:MAG: hypothetical protein E7388_03220 [Ruminococcaceae bacterium]|nr:hypothetical protein [Oscillospiraceae bacterium]